MLADTALKDVGAPAPADDGSTGAGNADGAEAPMVEARGVWVTRWDYRSPDDVRRIVEDAFVGGFNQVYFQVRGAADAYYRSRLVPWAALLAGKLGRDPGWDPLQEAIDQAHARGLELHAWINVCTGWRDARPPGRSRPLHALRAHPRWRVVNRARRPMPYADGAYVFLNPAHPGFQRHLEAVVAEIASFYAIDGLHLDYARYPSRDTSYDAVSNRRFRRARRKNRSLARSRWQREELTRLVVRLKEQVVRVRPSAVVSAAVTGIYEDRWGWGSVIQGKHDFHQDSHLWAARGAVDVLIPMIYWKPTDPEGGRADFATLVSDFATLASSVQLFVGINAEAGDLSVLEREVAITRRSGLAGVVLFSYSALKERSWFEPLGTGVFARRAQPPARPARGAGRVWLAEHRRSVWGAATRSIAAIGTRLSRFGLAWLTRFGPLVFSSWWARSGFGWPASAPRE